MTSATDTTTDRADAALEWLAGALRWERTLRDLGERAEQAGHPVSLEAADLPAFEAPTRKAA
jgi:hypothetical protein